MIAEHKFPLGWRVALASLHQLSTLCLLEGLKHVSFRRFGQDHVENLFCVIRGQNSYNDHPEYRPFQSAMRSAVLSNLLHPLSSGSNCEADDNDNLVTSALVAQKKVTSASSCTTPIAASHARQGNWLR